MEKIVLSLKSVEKRGCLPGYLLGCSEVMMLFLVSGNVESGTAPIVAPGNRRGEGDLLVSTVLAFAARKTTVSGLLAMLVEL